MYTHETRVRHAAQAPCPIKGGTYPAPTGMRLPRKSASAVASPLLPLPGIRALPIAAPAAADGSTGSLLRRSDREDGGGAKARPELRGAATRSRSRDRTEAAAGILLLVLLPNAARAPREGSVIVCEGGAGPWAGGCCASIAPLLLGSRLTRPNWPSHCFSMREWRCPRRQQPPALMWRVVRAKGPRALSDSTGAVFSLSERDAFSRGPLACPCGVE